MFLLLACGGFVLINFFPGLEEWFELGRDLVWYHEEEEATEKALYWLSRPEAGVAMARQGRQKVLERFTLRHTASAICKVAGL